MGEGEGMAALASAHNDDGIDAAAVLAVLGHELRLNIWLNLLPHGAVGLTAGAIAAQLEVGGAALSFHLQQLAKVGLLTLRHDRRYTFYSANSGMIDSLCTFLTTGGHADPAGSQPSTDPIA
jgi:ArsR family transcriptional regulator